MLFMSVGSPSVAQVDSSYISEFGGLFHLDSVVVTASRSGFNVDDFIRIIQEDEGLYEHFRDLRFTSYTFSNDIQFFSKKGKSIAQYQSTAQQNSDGECRTMSIFSEVIAGKYYKNRRKKKLRYYTSKLYERLFFTEGKVCDTRETPVSQPPPSGMAKHVAELKKLIFSPGQKADIPFIGKKTAIFNPNMAKYYDFEIRSETCGVGEECYVFSAKAKSGFPGKTVIKSLTTYFEKGSLNILGRDYHLKYHSGIYSFDVRMHIDMAPFNGNLLPSVVQYDGSWKIPMKKRERCQFEMKLIQVYE